jgi:hypothetical protein
VVIGDLLLVDLLLGNGYSLLGNRDWFGGNLSNYSLLVYFKGAKEIALLS